MLPTKQNSKKGMTLVEVMIVVAIFSALILVINTVIFSAQQMWSSTYPYSTLEEEALKIFKQIKGDLASSAVMSPPDSLGFSDTTLLPHISITGGSDSEGYFGNSIEFLIPTFDSSGQPLISVSSGDLSIDWENGFTVNYSVATGTENNHLVRTKTDNATSATTSEILTKNLVSIEFRDHDTSPTTLNDFYTVQVAIEMRRRTISGRHVTVRRQTIAYLRNSRGADDLGDY